MSKYIKLFTDPKFLQKFHATATIIWAVLLAPSILWWKESILWIIIMSVWANLAGHFSAYQAARAENKE